ncbi:MAG: FAD-binding oxidoreductase [Albidovulum sp.]|nr:FAD-binding oxidoreductase [Albidovulum sp.]
MLVVGAGHTGLSAGRTLAKLGKSVLILDSGAPCSGASSRNGGMIGGGHRLSISQLESQNSPEIALQLIRESYLDSLEFAVGLMKDEKIDRDYSETGRFRAFWHRAGFDKAERELERIKKRLAVEAEMLPRSRQRDEVGTDLYAGGIVYFRRGGLNPAKWSFGIGDAALRAGALAQGHTRVETVRPARTGFVAETSRGRVKAGNVLIATNGYTPPTFSDLTRRTIPVPSFIVATERPGTNRVKDLFPNGRMIVETRERHCYYRPSTDGTRIVFGGRAALIQVPEAFARREMRGLLSQVFPELKDIGLTHSWRGLTCFTFGMSPHIGKIDGKWHALGYCGNGNALAPYLGHKAALRMTGQPEGETAFSSTKFGTKWRHRGKPWFMRGADALFRIRDLSGNIRNPRARRPSLH